MLVRVSAQRSRLTRLHIASALCSSRAPSPPLRTASMSSPSVSPSRSRSRSPVAKRRPARSSRSSSPSPSRSRSRSRDRDRKDNRSGRSRRGRSQSSSPSPPPSSSEDEGAVGGKQRRNNGSSDKPAASASATKRSTRSSSRSPSPSPPRAAARAARRRDRSHSDSSEEEGAAAPAARTKPATVAASASPPTSSASPPRSLSLHPTAVPRSLLTRSSFSLHPCVFRLRFQLRLVQTCANILALKRAELQQLILDLIISECAASSGGQSAASAAVLGASKDGAIGRDSVEYMHLQRLEELNRPGSKPKQASLTLFSSSSDGSSLTSLTSGSGSTSKIVWLATVVLRCPSEAAAQYIVSHISGLNTNLQGYAVSVACKLLNSSTSSYDLRRSWEHFYFPTLTDTAARTLLAGAFGPNPFQITLAFNGMPAGHRPDTIVIKYLPIAWVDGTLLTRRGRQKRWLRLAAPATGNPAVDAASARQAARVRFHGNHEEDAVPGGSMSASELDSDEEGEDSGRAPSWRRLLLIIKRQLELLLKPAAKLASLQMDSINIKRWEYKPIEDTRTTVMRKRRNTNPEACALNAASEITDDMLLYPLSNPFPTESARPAEDEEEQKQSGVTAAEAPLVSHTMEPLCDLYLMLGDYPSVLAAFEYLHNKRLQNALDRTEEEEDADEDEAAAAGMSDSDKANRGRIVDLGVDVDREGFLRFDAIEARRQALMDEAERAKAAAQLAAHTARKKKEEVLRLQRERALRLQEEEEERAEELNRLQREAKQRELEKARMDADVRARFEARAQRDALNSIDQSRRAEERQRQAARRQAQLAEETAARGPITSKIDEEEAALLAEEQRAEEERLRRQQQLEALRRRREAEEAALASGQLLPPEVIDLASTEWDGVNRGRFTSIALSTLEHWFQQNIERPFPSESATTDLARETRLSIPQVREWFQNARKTRWKPTVQPDANAMLDDDDGMPGLMSAHDEAAADMARRVAAAQAAAASSGPIISMKIKQRAKVATDEETGADGFVRVDGLEQLAPQQSASTLSALPASHPLAQLPVEEPRSGAGAATSHAERQARQHNAEVAAMAASAAAGLQRAALPDKAAAALAAIAAKIKSSPAPSEAAAGTSDDAPAASPIAPTEEAGRKRSRSSSRSRSRSPGGSKKRSSRSKRHRSGSRSKRSRRSRRSRSRSGSVDPAFAMQAMAAMQGFPMPPWFDMPGMPPMFGGESGMPGGFPGAPPFPFLPGMGMPGMPPLPVMPGMPPMPMPGMLLGVPGVAADKRKERKNATEPTQEEALAELKAEKRLKEEQKEREERAAKEARKLARELAAQAAAAEKVLAAQAEAAQKALAAMEAAREPPRDPTPPSRAYDRESPRQSFRETPSAADSAYEGSRGQMRDSAHQPPYHEQSRDMHQRSRTREPTYGQSREVTLPLSRDFAREQPRDVQPLSREFPLSRDFTREQPRQPLPSLEQSRAPAAAYPAAYDQQAAAYDQQTVSYEPAREREPREVKPRRERSSRESRSARDPRESPTAAASSSSPYPPASLGSHPLAYDQYAAADARDAHSSRRDRSSHHGLPPAMPLSSGKYVNLPPSMSAHHPAAAAAADAYAAYRAGMDMRNDGYPPEAYAEMDRGMRGGGTKPYVAAGGRMADGDDGMQDVEGQSHRSSSKRGGGSKRRSKKSSSSAQHPDGFPVDDATRWRGGL